MRPTTACCHCSDRSWPIRTCSRCWASTRCPTSCRCAAGSGGFVRRMPTHPDGPAVALDLVVPRDQLPAVARPATDGGLRPAGVWTYEAHRVAGLRPRLGVDTDERTIPHEVGWIGTAVHLDKGCYRGQETVARVHNLGRPPRMLVLTHLDGSVSRPITGAPITAGGRAVGRLGTVVDHVDLGPVALALVKRGLAADTPLTVNADDAGDERSREEQKKRAREDRGRADDRPGHCASRGRRRRWPRRGRPAARRHAVTCAAQASPASGRRAGTVKCCQD